MLPFGRGIFGVFGRLGSAFVAGPWNFNVLYEPAQSKCHKSHFLWKFTRQMPYASTGDTVLREPAQSKCTWTCHKSRFV